MGADGRGPGGYDALVAELEARGHNVAAVEERLRGQRIETPSWGYGDSGTRFGVFAAAGLPRDPFEKLDDAAQVHRHTGMCPSVAMHIPWDAVDDPADLRGHAARSAWRRRDQPERLPGSRTTGWAACAIPIRPCAGRPRSTCSSASRSAVHLGSNVLSLWFADGTNYPGQDDIRDAQAGWSTCLLPRSRGDARRA